MGRGIAGLRERVVVATKAGLSSDGGEGKYRYKRNGRPEYIRAACDGSLCFVASLLRMTR